MTFQELTDSAPRVIKRKLEQLKFLRERPDYHPEPSTFHHIQIVTERLIPTDDIDLMLTGIMHDICKFDTVKMNEKTGYPTCPGHDDAAHDLILQDNEIQNWIRSLGGKPTAVMNLCKAHMRFHQLGDMKMLKREHYIQLWKEQGIWERLQIFGAADNMLVEFNLDNLEQSWKFNRI